MTGKNHFTPPIHKGKKAALSYIQSKPKLNGREKGKKKERGKSCVGVALKTVAYARKESASRNALSTQKRRQRAKNHSCQNSVACKGRRRKGGSSGSVCHRHAAKKKENEGEGHDGHLSYRTVEVGGDVTG